MADINDVKDALFLFVRHGTTLLNEEEKFRGWSDDDSAALDKKGVFQARQAGRFLKTLPLKYGIIISSDLDRSLHTAAVIGTILGISDIHFDARLRPLNVGRYAGLDKEKHSIQKYLDNPDTVIPGGESLNQFKGRWKDFTSDLDDWAKENPGITPILVDHLSGVVYWEDLANESNAYEGYFHNYAEDKEDLIRPGGVIAVMPGIKVVPLLGENKKSDISDKGGE